MPAASEPSGVLLVDKPVGPTSFDIVKAIRRLLRVKSAGHTGTLDPNASGLLPVCIGDATRIATFVTDGDKEYEALVRFGVETDTLDSKGTVVRTQDASHLRREDVEGALGSMLGVQAQAAPMYSARKVRGKRLYELARAGQEVERQARDIAVLTAELLTWAAPDASIRFRCSKGTYIRVLAEQLGQRLDVGAHLAGLRRTASGTIHVRDAAPMSTLEGLPGDELLGRLWSVERTLVDMAEIRLDERTAISVSFGNPVDALAVRRSRGDTLESGTRVKLVEPTGLIVAVAEIDVEGGATLIRVLRPRVGPGTSRRA